MAVNAGAWVINPKDRNPITYDYKGVQQFVILRDALNSHKDSNLIDLLLQSPLGSIYKAMESFHYSSTVLHQLLIRSVYSDRNDELRFRFRDTVCRFGRTEFALITGLNFGEVEPAIRPVEDRNRSHITIGLLQKDLTDAKDAKDAYKLGLIYLIEAVLHGKTSSSYVSPFVYNLVDDIPRFLCYSWGSYFWDITLKNFMEKRDAMRVRISEKVKVTEVITCLVYALFVWAYETLPSVGSLIANYDYDNKDIPRMLRWSAREDNIPHKSLSKNLDSKDLDVISYLKPSDVEVDMLRRLGLTDDEINTPPPLYTFPHDVCHPHEFVSPVSAPISDTDHVAACSKHVNAFDTSPNKSNATVSGITQLRTDLLGWRSCALSMHEEVSQDVKDATKDVRDNIDGVRHDIKYGRKLIHADLENMMNDSRNHFIGIRSKLSAMESLLNRQQFTRPPPQPSAPFMGKPNELPSQLGHQHTRDDHKLPHKKNQQQQGVDMNSDKKEQAGSASKITPCRQFRPCPPPPQPQPLRKHELSFHVVNRPTKAKKDGTTKSKKKKQLGSSLHDHGPDLSVHNSLESEVAEKPLWEDAYKPGPRELWPDPQVEVNYNETPHPDEVVIDLCMRNSLYQEKPKGNGLHDPVLIPDSSHSDPPTPVTKMVISAELPECPRSRRPTMRPGKLQDYVDPSTVARNKRKRYEPYRPIDLSKWLELRAWYNDPDALNMEIQGVFWNLTKPMDDASPYWFETLYTSQKWLGVTHIDAYLYLLRSRMQEHRSSFNDNVSIFSHSLGVLLLSESRMKSPDGTDRSVLEALCGLTEKSIVYTPWVFSSHWVALVISIPSWDVTVYDCLYGKGQNNEMDNKLRFLATSMAMLLKNSHDLKDDPRISQPFMVKRLGCDACPQMSEVGDCGVFTAKHIEHLILKDADLKDVKQENMDAFRDKMCVDIFHRNMDL